MRYTYAYRTSEGTRREDAIEAESRDDAFAALRARGIRPIKVVAADGSKANGEVHGVRKRWVAAIVAIAVVLAGITAYFGGFLASRRGLSPRFLGPVPTFEAEQTRRQVIGDAAVVDKGIATGWADVFAEEGERFFASFAIPGVKAGQRSTTVEELNEALARTIAPADADK